MMKRGKHDNEYARVKAGAAPKKPAPFIKPKVVEEEVHHTPEESARVQKSADAFKQHVDAGTAKERAEASARATAQTLRWNRMQILREWRAAGIDPPWKDAEGLPMYSLALALTLGWKVERNERGENMLMSPSKIEPRKRETQINEMGS